MILYDYRVWGHGDTVRVEVFDYNRSHGTPAYELEIVEGGPINEYYLTEDNRTQDMREQVIPVAIKVAMIGEIQEALLKLKRAEARLRNP